MRRGKLSRRLLASASPREIHMIRTAKIFLVSFSVLLLSAIAFAQGGAATGDLHITVKDPSGNNVTNATVAVQDVAKGLERTATSDGQGGYNARLLPPGTYTVTVTTTGFTKVESSGVSVTVGGLVELPITLTVAGGKEVIEVSSQAELVETSRTSTTDTIGQRRIDNLPINGRNYINFTLTDSQVVRDNAPNTGAAPTSGLNISGQRGRSNLVNVDGADATDNSVNGVRSTVSQEAVQEFQIITNGYAAEYGRAAGGVVNIITRSGSNEFHGDVFGYLRNRNFQAVNPFSTEPIPHIRAYRRASHSAVRSRKTRRITTSLMKLPAATKPDSPHRARQFRIWFQFDTSPFFGAPVRQHRSSTHSGSDLRFISDPVCSTRSSASPLLYAGGVLQYALIGRRFFRTWPITASGPRGHHRQDLSRSPGFPTILRRSAVCHLRPRSNAHRLARGNFPVFEGTSLYSLRLDHNIEQPTRFISAPTSAPAR